MNLWSGTAAVRLRHLPGWANRLVRVLRWPSLLSLDAPLVALAYAALGAAALELQLEWFHFVVLASSIWLAYALDRFLDGLELRQPDRATARHRLAATRRSVWIVAWLGVLALDLYVASRFLGGSELRRGLSLLTVVALYAGLVRLPAQWRRRVPKEILVGAILSAGSCLFLIQSGEGFSLMQVARTNDLLLIYAGLLAVLYALDCHLVSYWERGVDQAQDLETLSGWLPPWAQFAGLAAYLVLLLLFPLPAALAVPLAGAALWLLALLTWTRATDRQGDRGKSPARAARRWERTVIDLGLAVPPVMWLWLQSLPNGT